MVKQLCGLSFYQNEEELFDVAVNPHVAMMGNKGLSHSKNESWL